MKPEINKNTVRSRRFRKNVYSDKKLHEVQKTKDKERKRKRRVLEKVARSLSEKKQEEYRQKGKERKRLMYQLVWAYHLDSLH